MSIILPEFEEFRREDKSCTKNGGKGSSLLDTYRYNVIMIHRKTYYFFRKR